MTGHNIIDYSPTVISGYTSGLMFAAVWQDITAQNGKPISPGGNSTGTNIIYYHNDTVNEIVTVTWDDVGSLPSETGSAFQIRFHMLGDGNFVVENRYESVNNLVGAARLGWTNGDLTNFDEPYPSAEENFGNLIDTASNIDHPGVFAWMFVNGQVVSAGTVLEGSGNGTVIGLLMIVDLDDTSTSTYTLLDDADGRFELTIINGFTYVTVADGGDRLNVGNNETHDIRVSVEDSTGNTFEKTLTVNVIKVPEFLSPTEINVLVGEVMNVTIATKVEAGTAIPTVTATELPSWMTFTDNGDGSVTLHGFPAYELTFNVTLTMTDGYGNQTTRSFNVNTQDIDAVSEVDSTTTTVEVTVSNSDSGGSFGWLLVLIGGGLFARKRLK